MRALTYFWLMCGLALAAATATATEVKAPVVNKAAPARTSWHDPLSPIARDFLRQRMVGHAVAMNLLVAEVLLLRYDDARDSATLFVEEPVFEQAGFKIPAKGEEEEEKLSVFRDFVNQLDF